MDTSWGKYTAGLFFVLQGALWLTLYINQVALSSRLDALDEETLCRNRRDVRGSEESNNLLMETQNVTSVEVSLATEPPVIIRKKHRKNRRPAVEKFYVSMESTTAEPIMIRSSRTKSTSRSKSREHQIENPHAEDETKNIAFLTSSREVHHVAVPPAAIHFSSDASNYTKGRHAHYDGNGRIKVYGVYKDWRPAPWSDKLGTTQHFQMNQGITTVLQPGLYMLYAQIHYSNHQEINCYRAHHNGKIVAQCCTTSTHPNKNETKADTCGLLTTIYIESGDTIWLTDVHERYVILTPEKSFFGLIQLYQPPTGL